MNRWGAVLLLGGLVTGACRAELILAPGSTNVVEGARVEATLLLLNDAYEERSTDVPVQLTLHVRGRDKDAVVQLRPVDSTPGTVTIPPGAFLKIPYAGDLTPGLTGDLILDPVDFAGAAIVLRVAGPAVQATATAEKKTNEIPGTSSVRDVALFSTAFSPYEPNYFAAGSDGPTNAKFQVSLKFRLFNPNTRTPFLEKLYLGYSQTSIWDLSANSKPFRDSSYRPSLFFLDDEVSQWPFKGSSLGFQTGLEHESNGKDGANSRSINIAYVRPTFTFPLSGNHFIALSPKVYGYLDKTDNPDIQQYRGYADLLIKAGENDGLQLAATLRKGTLPDPYSMQLDLSYPLKKPTFGNLGGYLQLQYFEGYGESLLDYNTKVHPQIRFGLMITR